ncbi:MAG: hypothetical protein Q7R65_00245 [bacterium]|nr:hypothetical protein [bacterium]
MSQEGSQESPLQKRKIALEANLARLQEAREKALHIKIHHDATVKEHGEIDTLIDGLFKKAQTLAEEDTRQSAQMPETDADWEAWLDRTERIQRIYSKIADLVTESEVAKKLVEDIEREFDELVRGTEKQL